MLRMPRIAATTSARPTATRVPADPSRSTKNVDEKTMSATGHRNAPMPKHRVRNSPRACVTGALVGVTSERNMTTDTTMSATPRMSFAAVPRAGARDSRWALPRPAEPEPFALLFCCAFELRLEGI